MIAPKLHHEESDPTYDYQDSQYDEEPSPPLESSTALAVIIATVERKSQFQLLRNVGIFGIKDSPNITERLLDIRDDRWVLLDSNLSHTPTWVDREGKCVWEAVIWWALMNEIRNLF